MGVIIESFSFLALYIPLCKSSPKQKGPMLLEYFLLLIIIYLTSLSGRSGSRCKANAKFVSDAKAK